MKKIILNQKINPRFLDALNQAVEQGLINTNTLNELTLFNYSRSAQYDRRWNWATINARGLIVGDSGEVVAYPFEKFFNFMEGGRRPHGYMVEITEKMDGSLGNLYRHNDKVHIATRGSFVSDQAVWATSRIPNSWHNKLTDVKMNHLTLMFEIIYPGNRIVIDYGDDEKLVLLAARNRFTGEYLPYADLLEIGMVLNNEVVKTVTFDNVTDIVEATKIIDQNQEGWVVLFSDGRRFKFKGDDYRRMHALLSGFTIKHIFEVYTTGQHNWIETIPDELHVAYDNATDVIEKEITRITQVALDLFSRSPRHDTRKEFAQWVNQNAKRPYKGMLFKLIDGKPIKNLVINHVKQYVKDLFPYWRYG